MANQTSYTGMNGQSTYQVPAYSNLSGPTYPAGINQYGNWNPQNPYNQPQPQYQQQQQPQPQQVESQRVWVQGESSAKAFIVANNKEQVLWDSEQPVIYIKTVDATGKPSTVTLDYTIRNPQPDDDRTEIDGLKKQMNEMMSMLKDLTSQRNYKPNYKTKNNGGEDQ